MAVKTGAATGVVNEAAGLGPHADAMKHKIKMNEPYAIVFFIYKILFTDLQVNNAATLLKLPDPARDAFQ